MNRIRRLSLIVLVLLGTPLTQSALAQIPVTDIGAITQLITEVMNLEQQLATAKNQLAQAESTLRSMTGSRGMEQLLGGTNRNYLPTDWNSLSGLTSSSGASYGVLSSSLQSIVSGNSVLNATQLSQLGPNERNSVLDARASLALTAAVSRGALAESSGQFADLQQLINAIGTTADQKAILELQARINAEQTMISNDQTKLHSLFKTADSSDELRKQRNRERAIADVGSFSALAPMGL